MRDKIASALGRPVLRLVALFLWAITLFISSSFAPDLPDGGLEIPHIDKVMHFTYFTVGAFIFTTYILLTNGPQASKIIRIFTPIVLLSVVGMLDEYHQTFTPGRYGNDFFDLLADICGAITGTYLANVLHTRIKSFSFSVTEKS